MVPAAPQYAHKWPMCDKLGICLSGQCALVIDHPACCIVPCAYQQGHVSRKLQTHDAAVSPTSGVEPLHAKPATASGHWERDDLYCWDMSY